MTKYSKEDIAKVYQAEIHPILDDEDRIGEMSKDKREYISLFNDPEDYEDEIAEYDEYEPDDYADDVILDDVVYAVENAEIEITEEDLNEDMIKREMRETLQAHYPKASLDEIIYWAQLLRKKYGISIVPSDVFTREIWLDNFKKATLSQKIAMLLKAIKQKISDLFKRDDQDDLDIPF